MTTQYADILKHTFMSIDKRTANNAPSAPYQRIQGSISLTNQILQPMCMVGGKRPIETTRPKLKSCSTANYWGQNHLRSWITTRWPSKRPLNILLQQSVLLLNAVPNKKKEKKYQNQHAVQKCSIHWNRTLPIYYHGSSAATAGLLKTFAALYLLFVGIGSPAGV